MNYILPIVSVLVGFGFVVTIHPKNSNNLKLLLAFSGAFLLSLTAFSLLPEVYGHHHEHEHETDTKTIGIFLMAGILLQIFLEFFSKGAEHGHVHLNKKQKSFPWMLFTSLSIHALLEGFPLHHHDTLVYGIVIHKLPVAIILSTFFLESDISKPKIAAFLLMFALMTPLGTFLNTNLTIFHEYEAYISALVIGVLLHIGSTILFESSENHKFNLSKILVIILGVIAAYFID
ncbi:ZIP family metal transporter [Neptunitalea lumnitzerae]|uniref:ZIP family metal transporter n=1 Tax=Neptunitalea lumnitzerae TaxID=2965509 RepID=A0ABQ5MHP2_9FLAO|nr:ZIP family metal transporter [Neptunitalea sp. Y10]GLB48923.1 hypothetical protein Y10_12910 [Neptunitalea sp. Y10]